MKKIVCPGYGCASRRVHFERPDEERGPQIIEVRDDWPENRPVYCSDTCALLAGYITLKYKEPCPKCKAQNITVSHGDNFVCLEPEIKSVEEIK